MVLVKESLVLESFVLASEVGFSIGLETRSCSSGLK